MSDIKELNKEKIKMLWRAQLNQLAANNKYIYRRLLFRCLFVAFIVVVTVATVFVMQSKPPPEVPETAEQKERKLIDRLNIVLENDMWIPDGGDNETGWPRDIVPNIVHYVLFETHNISYIHMLSLFSVIQIQKPEAIIIHCDCDKMDDGDIHFERVINLINETNEVKLYIDKIEKPTEIFGRKLGYSNFHGSDVTRYRTLKKYGGIYLDNDVFVCQSLDEFRKFEFTLNWDEGQYLGSQVLMGNRNARFLKFVMETYKEYDSSKWYYNAGELPTKAILWKYPHLVHRVKVKFGVDAPKVCPYFYSQYHADWQKEYYTFHMVARGNTISWKGWCLGQNTHALWNATFDDELIRNMNTTFGEMGRLVLYGAKNMTGNGTDTSA